jgi:hypothetical protein
VIDAAPVAGGAAGHGFFAAQARRPDAVALVAVTRP